MMFRKLTIIVVAAGWLVAANAQADAGQTITLNAKQAVELALKNAVELKNAQLDYKLQDAKNKEIVGQALPQVTGSSQLNYYTTQPLIQFPDATAATIYGVLNREGVKDGNGNTIQQNNTFSVNNVSFVAPLNVNVGVTVQQLLFQPDVFVGLQARQAALDYQSKNIKVNEDKVKEQALKAYYQVLIAEKQLAYLQATIKRLQKLQSDQEQLFKNGFNEKLDIDKTQVALNNTITTENQLKNGIAIGYAALKMALSVEQKDKLVLTDTLNDAMVKENILQDTTAFDYSNRSEIQLLGKAKELQQLDLKRNKLGYLPTVAAFFSYQRQWQRNESFAAFTGANWFAFNTGLLGVNVSIPIFDGFQKKHKIQQSRFNIEKLDNSTAQLKRAIDLEQSVASSQVRNALLNLDVQSRNMQLAERVYNTTKKKYEQGLGNSFEVLQTDTELQRANGNYFQALYDAVVAKISYLKAVGKL